MLHPLWSADKTFEWKREEEEEEEGTNSIVVQKNLLGVGENEQAER